jgi:secreted PhoX family phosphatase
MDRPEDFEANPKTKKVYCALTNNTRRQSTDSSATRDFQGRDVETFPSAPNPRGPNRYGHVLEITEENDDNAATRFRWDIFLLAGDPQTTLGDYLTDLDDLQIPAASNTASQETTYFAGFDDPSQVAPIGSPDNLSFDNEGNLWIVTDGSQPRGTNNGGYAVPTEGPNRGKLRQFLSGPVDCEVCGAEFTPDNRTLFINIQHPGAVFAEEGLPTLENPSSYWPDSSVDGGPKKQPRPSLIAVRHGRFGRRRVGE